MKVNQLQIINLIRWILLLLLLYCNINYSVIANYN